MSRYATKAELVNVIKETAATDYLRLGTPLGIENFNVAGLIRDCKVEGDGRYGWTMGVDADGFKAAILANVRPVSRAVAAGPDPRSYRDDLALVASGAEDEPGFALDADGVSDVTRGVIYARASKSGEVEPFEARLGVRYDHEELAYWVSVEDFEGNVNGLWVETGAFLAMCSRMLGGVDIPAREVAPGTTALDPDIDPDGIMATCDSCGELVENCECAAGEARDVLAEWDRVMVEYADVDADSDADRLADCENAQLNVAPRLADALRALVGK